MRKLTKVASAACVLLACLAGAGHNSPPTRETPQQISSIAFRFKAATGCTRPSKHQRSLCVQDRWYRPTSAWNTRIPSNVPIAPASNSLVTALNNRWCMNAACLAPTNVSVPAVWVASRSTPLVTVQINSPTCNARRVRAPIPARAVPDGPPEGAMAIMLRDTGVEWDFFKLTRPGVTPLSSGPVCEANENWAANVAVRAQPGWTGSGSVKGAPRGSGTLYGTGLIRPRDTKRRAGSTWDHAVALAYPGTLVEAHVPPASHSDGVCREVSACIPHGARLQLDPSIRCSTWPTIEIEWQRQLCRTLQQYGMIIVDSGSALIAQHPVSLGSYTYPWARAGGGLPADLARRLRVIDWTKWTGSRKP